MESKHGKKNDQKWVQMSFPLNPPKKQLVETIFETNVDIVGMHLFDPWTCDVTANDCNV